MGLKKMVKKLTGAESEVVADEAAAEVREVAREAKVVADEAKDYDDAEFAKLPAQTQALMKAQKENK